MAKKSFSSPNFYGPGVGLNTNSRGFRGMMPVSDAVPNGKLRIVCSGDSFTLGWGVGDDEAWCAQLASDETDVVNMGAWMPSRETRIERVRSLGSTAPAPSLARGPRPRSSQAPDAPRQ